MHARLVENWLDSASERSYQLPFCQMLAAKGHRIIHSSRHSPIEQGKDIITVDKAGNPCAFQLKGNPGSKLNLIEFRKITNQLSELVNTAIRDPSIRKVQHKSYLVTNGLVEEEVRLAIDSLNEGNALSGYPDRKLEILQRGDLLNFADELGYTLWPSEYDDIETLLQLLTYDGKSQYPVSKIDILLRHLLEIDGGKPYLNAPKLKRRISSAAILTSISIKNFYLNKNYFAIIVALTTLCTYAIASCCYHKQSFKKTCYQTLQITKIAIFDTLISLTEEVLSRQDLLEGDSQIDCFFYRARYTKILSLLTVLWFWCEDKGWPEGIDREKLNSFLINGRKFIYLWGEGAIPQILVYYWFLSRKQGNLEAEHILQTILTTILNGEKTSPYFSYEDVVRHKLSGILGIEQDPLRDESIGVISYFSEPILHLLVRCNLKQFCKQIWSDFTKVDSAYYKLDKKYSYCMYRSDGGNNEQKQHELRKIWMDLVNDARCIDCQSIPVELKHEPFLLMLFIIIFPYRALPDVIRNLDDRFNKTWFSDPSINNHC